MDVTAETGKRIRAARESRRMTQEEVAVELGISRSALANIELGRVGVSIEKLAVLSRVLGEPVSYFLDLPEYDGLQDVAPDIRDKIDEILTLVKQNRQPSHANSRVAEIIDIAEQLDSRDRGELLRYARYLLEGRLASAVGRLHKRAQPGVAGDS